MRISIYQIDAFTDRLFGGNPAAVCPLEEWLPDATMQAIAAENNLSETAFCVLAGELVELRWFTPTTEVDLCGHATMAAAHLILRMVDPTRQRVEFETRSGRLAVECGDHGLVMDFPAYPPSKVEVPPGLEEALGGRPEATWQGNYLMAVFPTESSVRSLRPDYGMMVGSGLDETIVTAPGDSCDFVSRFFAPGYGIDEDPVTGSAHCTLAPYWAERLGRHELRARQVSARGGELHCRLDRERVFLTGQAVTYLEGTIHIPSER
jgi:predicted PhzF superfamily epimerase YddE/YHI9